MRAGAAVLLGVLAACDGGSGPRTLRFGTNPADWEKVASAVERVDFEAPAVGTLVATEYPGVDFAGSVKVVDWPAGTAGEHGAHLGLAALPAVELAFVPPVDGVALWVSGLDGALRVDSTDDTLVLEVRSADSPSFYWFNSEVSLSSLSLEADDASVLWGLDDVAYGELAGRGADDDGDGSPVGEDCDDADASVFPDAEEACDGVDQDCDGEVDEGAPAAAAWYPDVDGDGYGDPEGETHACERVDGYVDVGGDCNDGSPDIHPGAAEVCGDGVDADCGATLACGLEGTASVEGAPVRLLGSGAASRFGAAVQGRGDLDGDGVADLVVGAPADDLANPGGGAVYVFYGAPAGAVEASRADAVLYGWDHEGAGAVVATDGDRDGDGFAELWVLGVSAQWPGLHQFSSAPLGTTSLDDADDFLYSPQPAVRDGFGSSVLTLDVDGEGLGDLFVGAPGVSGNLGVEGGGVYRYTTGEPRLYEGDKGSEAGTALAGGDLDGDGYPDLVVGAPGDWGAAYVLSRSDLSNGDTWRLQDVSMRIVGEADGDALGTSVAVVDGVLALGAPGVADGGGAVYLAPLEPGFYNASEIAARWSGGTPGWGVGAVVVDGGSLDPSPGADLFVCGPGWGAGAGAGWVLFDAATAADGGGALEAVSGGLVFGAGADGACSAAGRVTGAGNDLDGLLLGAPGHPGATGSAGAAFGVWGGSGS